MSAKAMDTVDSWGLTAEFDKLVARLFDIANKQGVLLSVRVRKPRARPLKIALPSDDGAVTDEKGRVLGVLRRPKPAKKKAARK